MPDPLEVIHVAYKLSILTFYLGALVYALPIPWRGVKRWAPILVADGIFSLILLMAIDMMLYGSNVIARMLGGSWELLDSWISRILGVLLDFKLIITAVKLLPDLPGVTDGILYALSPIDKAVNAALFFVAAVTGVAWIVKDLGFLLLAIGLALYAVPFRISRSAGAWLIAFILVFNAGLQVMPVFISVFANYSGLETASEPKLGFIVTKPIVVGYDEKPVNYGILKIEHEGVNIVSLPVENGVVKSSIGDLIMLPPSGTAYFYLEAAGVVFRLDPSPIKLSDAKTNMTLNLKSNRILLSTSNGLLAYTTGTPIGYTITGDRTIVNAYLNHGDYLEARAPKGCITLHSTNGTASTGTIIWHNTKIDYIRVDPELPGTYTLTVSMDPACVSPRPEFTFKEWDQGATSLLLDINMFTAFIIYYFTIPLLYYTILFTVTFGLAKLLGGRDKMPVRIA